MIREATHDDAGRVVDMAARFLGGSEYSGAVPWNREALADTVARLIDSRDTELLVAEQEGELVGMLALVLYAHPFSGDLNASELAWWVEPEARSGGVGVRLLKAGEAWAQHRGARALQMIAPNEAVGALYEKAGYRQLETWFQRRF